MAEADLCLAPVAARTRLLAALAALPVLVIACSSQPGGAEGGNGGAAAGGSAGGRTGGAVASGGAGPAGSGGTAGGSSGGAGGSGAAGAGGNVGSGGSSGSVGSGPGPGGAGGAAAPDAGGDGSMPSGDAAAPAGVGALCRTMITAADAFLKSLDGDGAKRAMAALPFAMRRHFKYTPGDRPGLPLAAMTPAQRDAAFALVRLGLSADGFMKAEQIRGLELILRAMENSNTRDPLRYFLAVYGAPTAEGDWAWHWEGHHLSLHFTLAKCNAVADAPAFFGTNPARVGMNVQGAPPMGTRTLGKEEDLGRALARLLSMDMGKRAMAIATAGDREVPDSPMKQAARMPAGLASSAMNPAEVMALQGLIAEYANTMPAELAAQRLKKIQDAGFDKVTFLWVGSLEPGQAHYYRVQGPTFLIEYLNQQGNANHVHSAWRDFNGDFGDDVLARHLLLPGHEEGLFASGRGRGVVNAVKE